MHQLVLQRPGRVVADSQLTPQGHRRETVLRLGQQIHGEKPSRQRQLGVREDGANQRDLVPATGALKDIAAAAKRRQHLAVGSVSPWNNLII